MLVDKIRNELLVDELQLGERLNQDVHSANRADFALMLAMLSQDVQDNPIFSDQEKIVKKEDLRAKFMLPAPQAKYASDGDFERSMSMSDYVQQGNLQDVFLANCLNPEPLTPFEREFAPEVIASLPPLSQEKLRQKIQGQTLTYQKMKEQGDGFMVLDEIKHGRAMSSVDSKV